MPCELNASRVKHQVSDVPKSLSAHDCLIGVTDEQLLNDSNDECGSSSSSRVRGGASVDVDHLLLLPPRNPSTTTSRHYQSSNAVKPRGWYATRKAYRSVAYKTWSVGGARNMMNSQTDLESIPNGSVSDCEEKYFSAVDSDFEDCSVSGCRAREGSHPRKSVSTEMFYDSSDRLRSVPKDSLINNNYLSSNGSVTAPPLYNHTPITLQNGYSSVPNRRHPVPSPGCSDHEETDCYSSADYCRFNQKRNGFVKNRNVRSFDAVDIEMIDGNGCTDLEPYDEEMQTVIDTFEDLRNLRKIKQEKKSHPRSRSPFANTSQALVKKIQQVLPNMHNNHTSPKSTNHTSPKSSNHINDATCGSNSNDTIISANSEYYRPVDNNNHIYPPETSCLGLNYENYIFSNGEDAMEYLKNELANIRQRDFIILNQLRQVEMEIQSKKLSDNDLARSSSPKTVNNVNGLIKFSGDIYKTDRDLIPVPNCLLSNNYI